MNKAFAERGMMDIGAGLIAGWVSAFVFSIALAHADTPLILLAYFAALPLFMAGLGAGKVSAIVAAASGIGGLLTVVSAQEALIYTLVNAAPVTALNLFALRHKTGTDGQVYWYPEGSLVTHTALYTGLVFLAAFFMASGEDGGLAGKVAKMVAGSFDQIANEMPPEAVIEFKSIQDMVARTLPGILGVCWSLLLMGSAFGAQSILRKEGWNIRPPFSWTGVNVPTWVLIAAAIAGLSGAFVPDAAFLGLNLCILLCLPLFFAGLALVHLFAQTRKYAKSFLVLFYVLLSLVPQGLAILVTLLGVLDQAFALKKRLANPPKQV